MTFGLKFPNWSILFTCSTLIGLFVFLIHTNLNNSSVNPASSVPLKPIEGILKISGNFQSAFILHNENSSDGFAGNTGAESTTTTINQSETLSSKFAGSDVQAKRNESEVLLYRKRRYLLFPEGSSFQVVYDLIVPIVDYTNYLIMGVTCAVAWELPSKAPSEIEEEVIEKLNDGTLGLQRNDSIDNIEYIDTKPLHPHVSNIFYVQPSEYGHHVTYGRRPAPQPQMNSNTNGYRPVYKNDPNRPAYYTAPYPNAEFELKTINNRRIDSGTYYKSGYSNRQPKRTYNYNAFESRPPTEQPQPPPRLKQHAVYHIMGKRSVDMEYTDPHLEKLDRIHLRYHRTSRQSFYPKIEAMFNKQGMNGTECVLRALCEVGKRRHDTKPGHLLTEIIRTVFTLPTVDEEEHKQRPKSPNPKHQAWDDAYSCARNCADAYPMCENLIWLSTFTGLDPKENTQI